MLVSIIIPSFRQPQFLERAITSCLEQDHDELEVVIVEDCSMDASLGIAAWAARRDRRVRIVSCTDNGGLGRARNVGIAHASGELLCFLDSDDYLLDRSISARIEAFPAAVAEYGSEVVGVYGDWQHVPEAIDHPVGRQARQVMPLVSSTTFTGENVFICSAPLVRRDAVVAAGGFPEGLRMLEDFALWARMIAAGGVFVPVHHVVSTYRQRPNSMLRGDGVVVMADHVQLINDWVIDAGVRLSDGGALDAWLDDRDPRPYGRMSWSVPSVLGSFGGDSHAQAVSAEDEPIARVAPSGMDDFMANPVSSGLDVEPSFWPSVPPSTRVDIVVVASKLAHSLEAVSLIELGRTLDLDIAVATVDQSWYNIWPCALAGLDPIELTSDLDVSRNASPHGTIIDLSNWETTPEQRAHRIVHGANLVWPERSPTMPACVYVPREMFGYAALDAWLSTALHALAELGESPTIVADPLIRSSLGGYRSELPSIDRLRSVSTVVAPVCDDLDLLLALAPTVVFDPSEPTGDHARTRSELVTALETSSREGRQSIEPDLETMEATLRQLIADLR
jgi:glycosyltransferase involved in cell wall biosynthesis